MNKLKFEAYLRSELSILQNDEIDEIVSEYLQHIDMKVLEGVSEEEAIADFGDLNDLVDDLLSAYKIDARDRTFSNFETKSKSILNTILNFINSIVSQLMKLSAGQIIGLIIEFTIVLLLLTIFSSITSSFLSSIGRMFYFRPYFITSIIRFIISIVDVIISLSIAFIVLYWFAQERILGKHDSFDNQKEEKKETFKPAAETKRPASAESRSASKEESFAFKQENETSRAYKSVTDKIINESPKRKRGIDRSLFTVITYIFKACLLLVLIPAIVINVLSTIAYVYLVFATFSGYGSVGLVLIGAGFLLMLFSFNVFLIKLVGGKKDEEVHNNI